MPTVFALVISNTTPVHWILYFDTQDDTPFWYNCLLQLRSFSLVGLNLPFTHQHLRYTRQVMCRLVSLWIWRESGTHACVLIEAIKNRPPAWFIKLLSHLMKHFGIFFGLDLLSAIYSNHAGHRWGLPVQSVFHGVGHLSKGLHDSWFGRCFIVCVCGGGGHCFVWRLACGVRCYTVLD